MHRRSARLAAKGGDVEPDARTTIGSIYGPAQQDDAGLLHSTTAAMSGRNQLNAPFRFMDLPPEIRNNIYTQMFSRLAVQDLASLAIPPLIHASHQLRVEARSMFCAESTFRIKVGCNFMVQECVRQSIYRARQHVVLKQRRLSGVLEIQPNTSSFEEAAGKGALFRNIELEVYDSGFLSCSEVWCVRSIVATLHKRVGEGSVNVSVEKNRTQFLIRDPGGSAFYDRTAQDVERAIGGASSIARDIAAQDVFKGFKIADLKRIAMAFRLE